MKGRGLLPRDRALVGRRTRCLPVHSSLNLPQASPLLPRHAGAVGMTKRRGLLEGAPLPLNHAFHPGTLRTMFHIIPSIALSISSCGSVRVFARAAQHIPFAARTMMVVDPGKLPLCHMFPMPTIQPRAYFAAQLPGNTGLGVVMTLNALRPQNPRHREIHHPNRSRAQ